jgi:hypothetical protein
MRNLIGFDTPSKRSAMKEQDSIASEKEVCVDMEKLKMETISRLYRLGQVICSNEFQKFSQHQKQELLREFSYYSKVADSFL